MIDSVVVLAADQGDRDQLVDIARRELGSEHQVHSQRQFHVLDGEVLVARRDGALVGFTTLAVDGAQCEILAVATSTRREGIGRELMSVAHTSLAARGVQHVRVVTTDANVSAQRFYESLGYVLRERRVGAVDWCREQFKPELPSNMHDELCYERMLAPEAGIQ